MLKTTFKKIVCFILCLILAACNLQPVHVPHIIDNIPQRVQYICSQTQNLSPKVLALALIAYNKAQKDGYGDKHILTIIDYSNPSTRNRFWVIDLDHNKVLFREMVAHGENSGDLYATNFSDNIDSKQSSIGVFVTAKDSYFGRHGYSLRIKGLEPGYNSNAWSRAIVIHAAPYVCPEFLQKNGFVGRSWGCPAINPRDIKNVINTIRGGTIIFAYANVPDWLQHSYYLH